MSDKATIITLRNLVKSLQKQNKKLQDELDHKEAPKKKRTNWKEKGYTNYDFLRKAILQRDSHTCQQCGDKDNLHVHHIVYRGNGGTDDPDNLTTLCETCHAEVHIDDPVYNIMKR